MFVGRRADGSIYGTWTCRQPSDADHHNLEELPDDHPDIIAFLNRPILTKRIVPELDAVMKDVAVSQSVKDAFSKLL